MAFWSLVLAALQFAGNEGCIRSCCRQCCIRSCWASLNRRLLRTIVFGDLISVISYVVCEKICEREGRLFWSHKHFLSLLHSHWKWFKWFSNIKQISFIPLLLYAILFILRKRYKNRLARNYIFFNYWYVLKARIIPSHCCRSKTISSL